MEETEDIYKNYTFDGSTYFYTDQESKITYVWSLENNGWEIKEECNKEKCPISMEQKSKEPIENVDNQSCSENRNTVEDEEEEEEHDSDDETTKKKTEAVRQDLTQGYYGYEGDTHTYTDPNDGTVYFWDKEKKAWFPKIDDTFIAYYQMSYGFTQSDTSLSERNENGDAKQKEEKDERKEIPHNVKRKSEPEPPKWFNVDDEHNTKVYVSNLPLDITETEFVDLMQKCGLVMKDLETGKMKVKLYTDASTKNLKGDALCTYIKKESVELALKLLDGYDVRGNKMKVEKACFTMKGNSYDPNLKPKKKRKKDKEKLKKMQEKLFAWKPDKLRGERSKHECVVVIKNLFDPSQFDENLGLILEYREDIKEECSKCGAVKKVVIYDKHPDGVAQVWFKEAEAADACVQLLDKRWFGQRLVTAQTWDGKTKYKVQETAEEEETRLKKWEAFLNSSKGGGNSEERNQQNESSVAIAQREHEHVHDQDDIESNGTRSSAGSEDETDEEK